MLRVALGLLLSLLIAAPSLAQDAVETTIAGKRYYTGLLRSPADLPGVHHVAPGLQALAALPEAWDSRDHGYVTPIKNQGSCGSCWAFARTRAHEAALLMGGRSMDLSEQDTLVNDRRSYGCDGGFMDGRFEVEKGQALEVSCPYKANDRVRCAGGKASKVTRWAMLGARGRAPSVEELKAGIVQYGALAVTVAAGRYFSPDRNGRITRCGSRSINHMVNLVGYRPAPDGGTEFLIANSWGTGWGQRGFAWSKQGCNRLANSTGDAAMFFYVGGTP